MLRQQAGATFLILFLVSLHILEAGGFLFSSSIVKEPWRIESFTEDVPSFPSVALGVLSSWLL
jgi:hypothetical protein